MTGSRRNHSELVRSTEIFETRLRSLRRRLATQFVVPLEAFEKSTQLQPHERLQVYYICE